VRVRAEVAVKATESVEKVRRALLNLFPDAEVAEEPGRLVARTTSLERLREILREQRIRDTARGQMISGLEGNVLAFTLSKQAAFVGRASFAAGSPLGDIEVTVEDADLDAVIDWVAESTVGKRLKR